ncbi:LytTR family DNA-binding domain-containing protein [Roseinatronobacter sp. NSM]|uniref:LytTR family DNA-binding domain-containing protein n=1 Tax=Roseinatronobacter sp. NSM TaxID=3457785 RepID=UPI004035EC29
MAAYFKALQITLRERRWLGVLWAGLTGLATLAGPFGTMGALPLLPRAVYWGGVIAGAIALHFVTRHLQHYLPAHRASSVAASGVYAVMLGALVFGVNVWLFPGWQAGNIGGLLWLIMIVVLIAGAIHVLLAWLRPATAPATAQVPEAAFLARLPLHKRGPLIRLEAQDHYLNVVTQNGSELVLMRMADADAMLQGIGLRVHRSHWVVPAEIRQVVRQQGKTSLIMVDGASVPVSRSHLPALRAAGVVPR